MSKSDNIPSCPAVLLLAGLDPTGGAGLAADIGALSSMGTHALPVATCLTVQDTHNVQRTEAVDSGLLKQQLEVLSMDIPITTIKIGLLCASDTIHIIKDFLTTHKDIPVVFDPVIRAGGGNDMLDINTVTACKEILKNTTLLTPNQHEAFTLANTDKIDDAADFIISEGVKHLLITGTDIASEDDKNIVHHYFNYEGEKECYSWPRLLGHYHGSGCTLSSAIAGLIAKGLDAKTAIEEAQQYTWDTLANALRLSDGQLIPNRFYWSHDS